MGASIPLVLLLSLPTLGHAGGKNKNINTNTKKFTFGVRRGTTSFQNLTVVVSQNGKPKSTHVEMDQAILDHPDFVVPDEIRLFGAPSGYALHAATTEDAESSDAAVVLRFLKNTHEVGQRLQGKGLLGDNGDGVLKQIEKAIKLVEPLTTGGN